MSKQAINPANYETAETYEKIAKSYAYDLAVPATKDKFTAAQAKLELENFYGYSVASLSSQKMQDHGVYVYILKNETNLNAPLIIASRGTQWDDASVISMLDPKGPGYTQIKQNSEYLYKKILAYLEQRQEIIFVGHSSGCALAYHLVNCIIEEKNKLRSTNNLNNITIISYQPIGIDEQQTNHANNAIIELKKNEPCFKLTIKTHVYDNDIIFKIGSHPYINLDPNIAEVCLYISNYNKPPLSLDNITINATSILNLLKPIIYPNKYQTYDLLYNLGTLFCMWIKFKVQETIEPHYAYFDYTQTEKHTLYHNQNIEEKKMIKILSSDTYENIHSLKTIKAFLFNLLKNNTTADYTNIFKSPNVFFNFSPTSAQTLSDANKKLSSVLKAVTLKP